MLQRIVNLFRVPKYWKTYPRYCKDCKWSIDNHTLFCDHLQVGSRDPFSLGSKVNSIACWRERDNKNGMCSLVGFLWEPK